MEDHYKILVNFFIQNKNDIEKGFFIWTILVSVANENKHFLLIIRSRILGTSN